MMPVEEIDQSNYHALHRSGHIHSSAGYLKGLGLFCFFIWYKQQVLLFF